MLSNTEPGSPRLRRRHVRPHQKARQIITSVAIAAAVTACLAGCGRQSVAVSGTGRQAVCGTTLANSGQGAVIYGPTRLKSPVRYVSVNGWLYFRVSRGCAKGSHVTWSPRSAARLVKIARAEDGLPAAVVLKPAGPHVRFRVVATRDGRVVATAVVRL